MLDRARKDANIPDLTFRMCRTTFATLYEGDVKDVQSILGHHSAGFTLDKYKRAIPERAQEAVERMYGRFSNVVQMPVRKGA